MKLKERILLLRFSAECKKILKNYAAIYNGLYASVYKIANGNTRRLDGILKEWIDRTENVLPENSLNSLIEKIRACDSNGGILIAKSIMASAVKAGITAEKLMVLVLTEKNITSYIEWNGNELYEGCKVKVISPAWYQNGKNIEQGHCEIIEEIGEF